VASGTAVAQIATIAAAPVLTRLYSEAEFGQLAIFTAIATLLGNFATLRFEGAIPTAHVLDVPRLARLAALSAGVVCVVFFAVWTLNSPAIENRLLGSAIPFFGGLLAATAFLISASNIVTRLYVRDEAYRSIALRSAGQGIVQAVTQVVLGVLLPVVNGLLAGLAVGRLAGLAGARLGGRRRRVTTGPRLSVLLRRYRRFPLISSWSSLLNSAGLQVPVLLIGAGYSIVLLGAMALAQRVLAAPTQLLAQSLENVTQGYVGRLVRRNEHGLGRIIARLLLLLSAAAFVPAAVTIPFAPAAFQVVFGEDWREAGVFYQILVLPAAAQIVALPLGSILMVLELQSTQAVWDAGRALTTIGAVAMAIAVGAGVYAAALALAVSQVLWYGVLVILVYRAAAAYDFSIRDDGR